jgi:hypothetical protein
MRSISSTIALAMSFAKSFNGITFVAEGIIAWDDVVPARSHIYVMIFSDVTR